MYAGVLQLHDADFWVKFDPSLLGLDDDLSDQFDGPHHRDGEDGDIYGNNRARKKVHLLSGSNNFFFRSGKVKTWMSMGFRLMNARKNERKRYFRVPYNLTLTK